MKAVFVDCHANSSSTALTGAIFARASHLVVIINLVVLEHSKLDGFVVVLGFLGLCVCLLLSLLGTTAEAKNQVEGRFLLNVVVRESAAILELLSGKY